jgi:hypothetical protein
VTVVNPALAEVLRQIKRRTAVHEAAHAVVAHELGWQVIFIELADVEPSQVEHADTWALTRCAVPASRQHDIVGVAQPLAGHVAERLFDPNPVDEEKLVPFTRTDDTVDYITQLRLDEGDKHPDFAAAWDLLEFNLALPGMLCGGTDGGSERETAFDWAVRYTCRLVLPLQEKILRVAELVEGLEGGERLDGADIVAMMGPQ